MGEGYLPVIKSFYQKCKGWDGLRGIHINIFSFFM